MLLGGGGDVYCVWCDDDHITPARFDHPEGGVKIGTRSYHISEHHHSNLLCICCWCLLSLSGLARCWFQLFVFQEKKREGSVPKLLREDGASKFVPNVCNHSIGTLSVCCLGGGGGGGGGCVLCVV